MNRLNVTFLTALLLAPLATLHAVDDGITWLTHYDAKALPAGPWATIGKPNAKLEGCDLHLKSPVAGVVGAAEKLRPPLTTTDCADDFSGHPRRSDGPGDIGAVEHPSPPAVKE